MHVSDVIQTRGPRAFCARYNVMNVHSPKERYGGKLTPARRLLFKTGNDLGDYIISQFFERAPDYAQFIYAKWSCESYRPRDPSTWEHKPVEDTHANVISLRCPKCSKRLTKHNEIDLELPGLLLVGHPDMVIRLGDSPANYKFYIYEFKTIDRRDMSYDDVTMVLSDHRLQVTFYYQIMRARGWSVSKKLRVLYIDRSNSKLFGGFPFKELVCDPEDPDLFEPFRTNLRLTKHGIRTKKLPDRICPTVGCERARQCDRAIECFERREPYVREIHHWRGRGAA